VKQPPQNGWLLQAIRLPFWVLPDCLFSGAFAVCLRGFGGPQVLRTNGSMTFGVVGSVGWYGEVEGNQKKPLEHRIETNNRI